MIKRLALILSIMMSALLSWGADIELIDLAADARAKLDSLPLHRIEGIWIFTDDKVEVLILRRKECNEYAPDYDVTVINDPSGKLRPGEVIGSVSATPSPTQFGIKLKSKRILMYLAGQTSLKATLTNNDSGITIVPPKIKWRISPTSILPGFWGRLISLHIRKGDEPPTGLVRIYPTYDGNSASPLNPRYL